HLLGDEKLVLVLLQRSVRGEELPRPLLLLGMKARKLLVSLDTEQGAAELLAQLVVKCSSANADLDDEEAQARGLVLEGLQNEVDGALRESLRRDEVGAPEANSSCRQLLLAGLVAPRDEARPFERRLWTLVGSDVKADDLQHRQVHCQHLHQLQK